MKAFAMTAATGVAGGERGTPGAGVMRAVASAFTALAEARERQLAPRVAAEIGRLSDRDLKLAGWSEGEIADLRTRSTATIGAV